VIEEAQSKVDIFMPLFPGDYWRDTGGLNAEEHGVYLQLLMRLWVAKGSLPFDQARLARMTSIDPTRWPEVWQTISHFFEVEDGFVKHRRVLRDLVKTSQLQQKRREAGRKGGSKRQANAKQTPSKTQATEQANGVAKTKDPDPDPDLEDPPPPAQAPDPSTTTTAPTQGWTGHQLLRRYAQTRTEYVEGALPWDMPISTAGKASSFAEGLDAGAAADVEATMAIHFAELKQGRGKAGALENPTFGFGCWMADFTRLREKLHGKTPTRTGGDDRENGGPRYGADAASRSRAQQIADDIAARNGG
jgi:uncharacterized protein YdaU (DUF1376 family)